MKHPESFKSVDLQIRVEIVKDALRDPDIVVKEKLEPSVHLYYREFGDYFICVVTKHLNGDGYIITSYKTDRIKKGEIVWKRE